MIEVVMAVLKKDGKYLLAQRPLEKHYGGLWEFPGGKVETGESPSEAIFREIKEELNIEVISIKELPAYEYIASTDKKLLFRPIQCDWVSSDISLREHVDMCWAVLNELDHLELAPPDYPLVEALRTLERSIN